MSKKKPADNAAVKIPAVIYARYSSSGQREESIEGQIRECTEYAERHGFVIVEHYTDKALTGRTDKRPGFQKMIADSEKCTFQAVICWKTDRFARNRYDAATYKYKLKKNGVRLYYAREAVPEGPEGIILESVMEGFAEYYSANLSENVKRGYYDSALQYKTLGHKVLGYRRSASDQYEIDPETAPIVKRIFDEYASGRSMQDIIADLNAEGYKTTAGGLFNKSSLRRILQNKKYIGVYEYRDIYAEDGVPAIIDRDLFDRVAERLKLKAHAPRAREGVRFLLTSKLFCGYCGEPMTGESARGEHGQTYYYYTCNNRKRGTCRKKRVNKEDFENFVISSLVEILQDDYYIETLADLCLKQIEETRDDSTLQIIERKQKENQKAIDNMITAIKAGIITSSTKEALQELETERERLQVAYAKEVMKTPDIDRDQIIFILDKIRKGDPADTRYQVRIVETFLNSIYLYDDGKTIIHLNFKGDNAAVTLAYTEKAAAKAEPVKSSTNEPPALPCEPKTNSIYGVPVYIGAGIVSIVKYFDRARTAN